MSEFDYSKVQFWTREEQEKIREAAVAAGENPDHVDRMIEEYRLQARLIDALICPMGHGGD